MKMKIHPVLIAVGIGVFLLLGCVKNVPPSEEVAEEDPEEYDNGPEAEKPLDWGDEEEWIDEDDREIPEVGVVRERPTVRQQAVQAIGNLVDGVEIGRGVSRRGVTIFPLIQRTWNGSGSLKTLDQYSGNLVITDRAPNRDEIARVYVDNQGRHSVLLFAGELLVGGMQNRIVAMDIIVPAGVRDFAVPVFSAEANRWSVHETRMRFVSSRDVSPAPIRYTIFASPRQSLGQRNQLIHREINALLNHYRAKSGTEDLSTLYAQGNLPGLLQCFYGNFVFNWPDDTVGFIAMSERKILGIEIFPNVQAFQANWRKTLDGILAGRAVLDQACRNGQSEVANRAAAQAVLNFLLRAQLTSPTAALAQEERQGQVRHLRIVNQYLKGMALLEGGSVIHLSVLGPAPMQPEVAVEERQDTFIEYENPEPTGYAAYWYDYTYWYGHGYWCGYPYWYGPWYRPYWAYYRCWPHWPYWPYWAYWAYYYPYPPYPPHHRPPHDHPGHGDHPGDHNHPDHPDDPGNHDDPDRPSLPAIAAGSDADNRTVRPGDSSAEARRDPNGRDRRFTTTSPTVDPQATQATGAGEVAPRRPVRPASVGAKPEQGVSSKPKSVKRPAAVGPAKASKPPVAKQTDQKKPKPATTKADQKPSKPKPPATDTEKKGNKQQPAADQTSNPGQQPVIKLLKSNKPKKPATAKPAKTEDKDKNKEEKKKKK